MKHIEETNLKLESEEQLKNCEDMHIWVQPIKDYIKELEVKEECAKKVEELLELYRTQDKLLKMADVNIEVPTDEFVMWLNTTIKIKALEEKMK